MRRFVRLAASARSMLPTRYGTLAGLMWRASPLWSVVAVGCAVVAGLLPNLMIVATGILVGALGDAVGAGGFDSAAGRQALLGLGLFGGASVAFALNAAGRTYSTERLSAAYVPLIEDSLAAASLGPERIDHLEDPEIARRFAAATEASRENVHLQAVSSGLIVIEVRTTGVVSGCLLVAFHWWAPVLILASMVVLNWAFKQWEATAFDELIATTGTARRRAEYLRKLAVEPQAAKELRIFGIGPWLVRRYADMWLRAMEPVWRNRRRSSWPLLASIGAMLVANGIVLGVMGSQAYAGAVSVGAIAVYVQAIGGMEGLGIIGDPTWALSRAAVIAEHVHALGRDLGVRADDATDRPAHSPVVTATGPAAVSLAGVRFTYGSREAPTLDGLDLNIPAGQSIAIVGANGAGKSTLIKLLCGLYAADAGRVTVDGRDAGDPDQLAAVRRRVAVIFQDFVRYELPLRDNIGFGNPAARGDATQLATAWRDAGGTALADRVGWDTVLSSRYDGGTDLSGGQWQRVALARALAALDGGAGVLILDEPTASLDVRAEAALFDRFLEVTRGTTTVLVSHRLSSVRHVERIVVLNGGRITEDGSHEELLAAGGEYARMFTLQAQRFVDEDGVADGNGERDA